MKTLASLTVAFSISLSAVLAGDAGYVAHEWGTFTSVQGADGVQMQWNPFVASELPGFVYDRNKYPGRSPLLLTKTASFAKQRLETPVIYFHSTKPRTVNVAVKFPKGTVTEWYPRADLPILKKAGAAAIEWRNVAIEAKGEAGKLPTEEKGSHYYAAREAEANLIRVSQKGTPSEMEKFLFYRGTGQFDAPLAVTLASSDESRVTLKNTGAEALRDLFLVQVRDGRMAITPLNAIEANGTSQATVGTPVPLKKGRAELGAKMQAALVRAGLYESEAAAMVKTWDDSWFAEEGLRILYVLPVKWADEVLPLAIEPAPREIVRTFVGRAEVITPAMEQALAVEVGRYSTEPDMAIAKTRALGLGRFLEPAFRRLVAQHPQDRAFSTTGWELMSAAARPEPAAPPKLTSVR